MSHTERENQFHIIFDSDLSETIISNEEQRLLESNMGDLIKGFLMGIEEEE